MLRRTGCQVLVFCCFMLLLGWPLLTIPALKGIKATYLYLYGAWAGLIVLLFFISRALKSSSEEDEGQKEELDHV